MLQGEHAHRRRKLSARAALIAVTTAGALSLPAAPALAQTGPVSPTPVAGTPTLVNTPPGTTQTIRQLADCGGTMYAVGTFTQVEWNGTIYDRNNAFAFSDTAPFTMHAVEPERQRHGQHHRVQTGVRTAPPPTSAGSSPRWAGPP